MISLSMDQCMGAGRCKFLLSQLKSLAHAAICNGWAREDPLLAYLGPQS